MDDNKQDVLTSNFYTMLLKGEIITLNKRKYIDNYLTDEDEDRLEKMVKKLVELEGE